jgi:hypothetical protein
VFQRIFHQQILSFNCAMTSVFNAVKGLLRLIPGVS